MARPPTATVLAFPPPATEADAEFARAASNALRTIAVSLDELAITLTVVSANLHRTAQALAPPETSKPAPVEF